jgi:DNA mismatch repair protein MutL
MAKIHRLSKDLASQIAAGEVIERPVSVVKELLENAMDAEATQIVISIMEAGLSSIKIEDNGIGIDESDLVLALEPHCTSKIQAIEDLYEIQSKGFRGEALASMVSVAKIDLCSRPSHQAQAMRMIAESGQYQLVPAVRDQGTTIEVKDLFFNVPVRKKFLKAHAFEWAAIESLVKRFVMSAPHVHFILKHHHEVILDLPIAHGVQEQFARIKKIWGKSFENAQWVGVDRSGLKLFGWVGDLQNHRSQNDRLWVFLNERIVQDKLILHALKQVYLPLLPPGRHPQCVLYLETPPGMVDINVHPAKQEVRFEQPRLIYDFIMSSLKDYWQQSPLGVPVASNEAELNHYPSAEVISHAHQSAWTICNAEHIIVSQVPHQYLIQVNQWWEDYLKKHIEYEKKPLESRTLIMPYIQKLDKFNETLLLAICEKVQDYGLDMQIWGQDSLCIRAIPVCLPQFNLKMWTNTLNRTTKLEDIQVDTLIKCCQLSAYDISMKEFQLILEDLNPDSPFARPLDVENCRKIFK